MSLINKVLQDLEKRHASAAELKTLPPNVRVVPVRLQSHARTYGVAVVLLLAITAVIFYLYGGRPDALNDAAAPLVSAPARTQAPAAASVPPETGPSVIAPPVAAPPEPVTAFNPVSRLSDELRLVAPIPSSGEGRPVPGKSAGSGVAKTSAGDRVAAPARKENSSLPVPAPGTEAAAKPASVDSRPISAAAAALSADSGGPTTINKKMREVASAERAEIAFRKGVAQLQEGRASAAEVDFREALKLDPSHAGASQALLGLLLDSGRNNEAEKLMRTVLGINPRQPRHAMVLARLEVERGEVTGAINTMVGALPYVQSDPEFHAFLAALLQREGRHREAAEYYRVALRGVPGHGVWMMGLGISLRAASQAAEARDAFQRAVDSRQLTPDLQEFVGRQLRELAVPK